jgi:glycosyltransferase involved in cell wall biosynthesis
MVIYEVCMKASAGSRVLILLENNFYPQDARVRGEAEALVKAGYQVSVICPVGRGQPRCEVVDGVRVYRFPAPPAASGFLGYLWEYGYSLVVTFLISLLVCWRDGFDIIHATNPPDTFVFIAACYKLFGKRFVYDHHDLSPEMYYARFGGKGNRLIYHTLVWLEKLSCRLADHVIATNQSYKTVEMQRGRVPEERITIVRNGPELDRMRLVDPDPELRQKGKTIIGYVGVMGFQDGVDYLLRALQHLVYDLGRTDFFCVIMGKGDAWTDLKELSTQLGLDEYVWLTGRVSDADLIRYLSTADICVDPDPSNPFNDRSTMIKMMEYMALAKPIVAFDLPEHRFTAQAAALYVRPNDEFEFAQALAQLMNAPELRQTMGSFGRQRVEAELAWHHSVPNLLEAYHKVLSEPFYKKASLS